jgi:hypothetical protein
VVAAEVTSTWEGKPKSVARSGPPHRHTLEQLAQATATGFTGATGVTIDGGPVSHTVNSDTQITATSARHSAGTGDAKVATSSGASAATEVDRFTFVNPIVSAITPLVGAMNTSVPIFGR